MKLIDDKKAIDCTVIEANAFSALSVERIKILKFLAGEPTYPAQIARELHLQVQTVYYHVRELQRAGLVKLVDLEEKGGAMAKKYAVSGKALAVILQEQWEPFETASKKQPPQLFSHFIKDGFFNGKFILGSPDPHGKYRSRASEFCACELSMILGKYCSFTFPLYLLDTELKTEDKKNNLVLIGGPKVNSVVSEVNSYLPIKFDENTFSAYSTVSKKRFSETVGLIELIDNPFTKGKKLLFVGGINYQSTRAAVLAIVNNLKEIEKGNTFDNSIIARVVEGFDENGDGVIDNVEFLE